MTDPLPRPEPPSPATAPSASPTEPPRAVPLSRALRGIFRANFLVLPVALVAAGAAAAAYDGDFSWTHTLLALVGLVAAHAGVNALNEASDMETGIDLETRRTPFHGGSGTLPAGLLSVRAAYAWGLFVTAIATAIGAYFLAVHGPVVLWVFLPGLFAILAYTHFLTRIGVGEIFAGFGLGTLPILGTALVQDGRIGPAAVAASIPAFFMTFNLLFLNEFPDEEADRRGGRRHLVILLGRRGASRVYAAAVLLTPVAIAVAVVLGALPWPALFAMLPTLLSLPGLRWALGDPEVAVPLPALGANVAWNLVTNFVLALALALALALS